MAVGVGVTQCCVIVLKSVGVKVVRPPPTVTSPESDCGESGEEGKRRKGYHSDRDLTRRYYYYYQLLLTLTRIHHSHIHCITAVLYGWLVYWWGPNWVVKGVWRGGLRH